MGEYVQCCFLALVSCLVLPVSMQALFLGPITFQPLHSKVRLTPHPAPPLLLLSTHPPINPSIVFIWTPPVPILSLSPLPSSPSPLLSLPWYPQMKSFSFPCLPLLPHKSNTSTPPPPLMMPFSLPLRL